MVKYSVIVPVYKVETVLPRCIESILGQTEPDFELILIDDGSPDRSGEICDEYAEKDSRIKVIHQENGGVSRARNAGLDIAKGAYIVFVDSDDYVEKTYLEAFNASDSDLVISRTSVYGVSGELEQTLNSAPFDIIITSDEECIHFLKQWYAIQVWGKRFVRRIVAESNLAFDTSISYGEDSIFLAQYLLAISSVCFVPISVYCFCKSTVPSLSKLNTNQFFPSYTVLQEKLLSVFADHRLVQHYLAERYCWVAENEIVRICKSAMPKSNKRSALKKVFSYSHLSTCSKTCCDSLSARTLTLFRLKSPGLALVMYALR